MKGFDCATPVGGIVPKIKAAGIDFVGRYYSRNPRKNLSATEARALSDAGIAIVSVWEAAGDQPSSFGMLTGQNDGIDAMKLALAVGQPQGTTIYFAVDFDASGSDVTQRIMPYFRGVMAGLGGLYQVGVYGSGMVCAALKMAGLVSKTWLANARLWTASLGYAEWDIQQSVPSDPYGFGFQVDPDEARGDYGGWMVSSGLGEWDAGEDTAPIPPRQVPKAAYLQGALKAAGCDPGPVDGVWGPRSAAALAAYYGRGA